MYVDKDGKRLKSGGWRWTRSYILQEPNLWHREIVGRIEWNGHRGEQHGFWFIPTEYDVGQQLKFEEVMKSPKVLRCNNLRRLK